MEPRIDATDAVSCKVAVLSMRRAMRGFVGPQDIFRNPEVHQQHAICWQHITSQYFGYAWKC
eukprot:2490290-Amphidinium_carterae.2